MSTSASETGYPGSLTNEASTFGYKRPLVVASWNVRYGVEQPQRLTHLTSKMAQYHIDILSIQEAGKLDSGQLRLHTGHTLLWSGPRTQPGQPLPRALNSGAALILSPRATAAMKRWDAISPRLLTATFGMLKRHTLDVVAFYAPHSSRHPTERKDFRTLHMRTRNAFNRHHHLVELGDANALIGSSGTSMSNYGGALGPHGIGHQNAAGRELLEDCATHGLCVANTFFTHKNVHKYTHRTTLPHVPVGGDPIRREINNDFILVRRNLLSSVRDVRVYRGANGNDYTFSDHHLLVATLKLRFRGIFKRKPKRDIGALARDPRIRELYQEALDNATSEHQERFLTADVDAIWSTMAQLAKDTEELVLPEAPSRLPTQPPPSLLLLELARKKKEILSRRKTRGRDRELKALNKLSRKEARRLRALEREELGDQLEDAARRNDQGTAWRMVSMLAPKSGRHLEVGILKDSQGHPVVGPQQQTDLLASHYRTLLNEAAGARREAIDALEYPVDTPPGPQLTAEDIQAALSRLKNGKAAGPNGIRNEHLKYAGTEFMQMIYKLAFQTWTNGLPAENKVFHLLSIPKKGDPALLGNHRGIQLGDKLYLLKAKILADKLTADNETRLLEHQAGFRPARGCRDQRCSLQLVLDEARDKQQELYVAFVDLEKAFDRVDRSALLAVLRHYGVQEDYVTQVEDLHTDTSARVRWKGIYSAPFAINWGVQQGSPASNPEWNLYINRIAQQTLAELGPTTGVEIHHDTTSLALDRGRHPPLNAVRSHLLLLLFADDIAITAKTAQELTQVLETMDRVCEQWGMRISTDKTKILMTHRSERASSDPITLRHTHLETVSKGKYLGSWFTADGCLEPELQSRIASANVAVARLQTIWRSRAIGRKTKIRLYRTLVLTILLYGAESWPVTQSQVDRLEAFHQRQLRRILRVRFWQHVSCEEVLARASTPSMADILRQKRMAWLGHVMRMPEHRLVKQLLCGQMVGSRRKGRPQHTLRRVYEQDILAVQGGFPSGLSWTQVVLDRFAWRSFVNGTPAQPMAPLNPSAPVQTDVTNQRAAIPLRRSARIAARSRG